MHEKAGMAVQLMHRHACPKQSGETGRNFNGKEGKPMRRKIKYTNEPMKLKVINDFLPSPDQLVEKDGNIKVNITLSKVSAVFFKGRAKSGVIRINKNDT